MWNLLEDVSLFDRPAGDDGEYDAHVHLAQMMSLLGDPPQKVVDKEREFRKHKLKEPITNPHGKECNTMNEFWGGPFFDDDGKQKNGQHVANADDATDHVLKKHLIRKGMGLCNKLTELSGAEKETFLDFASGMLQWQPEKRKTARELMQHPFFDSFYQDRERD